MQTGPNKVNLLLVAMFIVSSLFVNGIAHCATNAIDHVLIQRAVDDECRIATVHLIWSSRVYHGAFHILLLCPYGQGGARAPAETSKDCLRVWTDVAKVWSMLALLVNQVQSSLGVLV